MRVRLIEPLPPQRRAVRRRGGWSLGAARPAGRGADPRAGLERRLVRARARRWSSVADGWTPRSASIPTTRRRSTTRAGRGSRRRRGRRARRRDRRDRPRLRPGVLADRGPAREPPAEPRARPRDGQAGDPPLFARAPARATPRTRCSTSCGRPGFGEPAAAAPSGRSAAGRRSTRSRARSTTPGGSSTWASRSPSRGSSSVRGEESTAEVVAARAGGPTPRRDRLAVPLAAGCPEGPERARVGRDHRRLGRRAARMTAGRARRGARRRLRPTLPGKPPAEPERRRSRAAPSWRRPRWAPAASAGARACAASAIAPPGSRHPGRRQRRPATSPLRRPRRRPSAARRRRRPSAAAGADRADARRRLPGHGGRRCAVARVRRSRRAGSAAWSCSIGTGRTAGPPERASPAQVTAPRRRPSLAGHRIAS